MSKIRHLLVLVVLLFPSVCLGQSLLRVQKFCEVGNQQVILQGVKSSNKVQQSFPQCLVTVYNSGTTNKSSIYSDNLATPTALANPFIANVDGSFGFYAAPGACYDVVTSGAGFPAPFTYSYICLNTGGGGGSVNCPTALNGSIGAFTAPTAFSCDPNFFTDFAGNFTAQSGQFIGPVNGFITLIGGGASPGTQAKFKLPANAVRFLAPTTVGTSFYVVPPATRCTSGQTWVLATETTDGNGDKVDTYQCGNVGASGVEAQTNGADNANCSGGVCPLVNLQNGTGTTVTNPSGGIWQVNVAAPPKISTPSAPTLTTNGSAGATSYTYKVVGCEDGPTCAYHTDASGATTIATGNATLTSGNSINIKLYADTLYGPRCYNIYRTASSGTPSSTGLIGNCVWKQFIDTGLAGDSTTAPTTNTTTLDANGLTAPLPGCNKVWAAPWGIDGPPCTGNALDDEFTWGNGTFLPADVNDPQWTWVNQNSATVTLTSGEVILTSPSRAAAHNLNCIVQPMPAAAFTATAVIYPTIVQTSSGNSQLWYGFGFYESGTGKFELIGQELKGSNSALVVQRYSSTTATGTTPVFGPQPQVSLESHSWRITYDGSTNISFRESATGVSYITQLTEAKNAAFTTAPNNIGICIDNFQNANQLEIDYFRVTNP